MIKDLIRLKLSLEKLELVNVVPDFFHGIIPREAGSAVMLLVGCDRP